MAALFFMALNLLLPKILLNYNCGPAGRYHHHPVVCAEDLIIHVHANHRIRAYIDRPLLHFVDRLSSRVDELFLITLGPSAKEISEARAKILDEIDPGDDLAKHDLFVFNDAMPLYRGSCG